MIALPTLAGGAQESREAPPLELFGITFVSSRGPVLELVLEARQARLDPETRIAELEQVQARLLDDEGELRLALACDRGQFDLTTNDFTAWGHVRGRTAEGRRFSSSQLSYQHEQGLAASSGPVLIEEGTRTLRGGGFRYHVREGRLRLLGGAAVVETP